MFLNIIFWNILGPHRGPRGPWRLTTVQKHPLVVSLHNHSDEKLYKAKHREYNIKHLLYSIIIKCGCKYFIMSTCINAYKHKTQKKRILRQTITLIFILTIFGCLILAKRWFDTHIVMITHACTVIDRLRHGK